MKINALLALLATSTAMMVDATPLLPQAGRLQMHRRRAVDYVQPEVVEARKLRHRAINYSVVPVFGSSSTTAAPAAIATATTTVVKTVEATFTPSALGTATAMTVTDVVSNPAVTRTLDVPESLPQQTVTDVISNPAVTETLDVTESLPQQTVTVQQESTVDTSVPVPTTKIITSIKTLKATAVITVAPSSSTQYYDNGQWHTSYPVKSFPVYTAGWQNASTSATRVTAWKPTMVTMPSS